MFKDFKFCAVGHIDPQQKTSGPASTVSKDSSPQLFTGDSLVESYVANNIILCIFSIVICIFGLVGNGLFLWLLAFNIKRNVFTTYFRNFSLASFGFLSVLVFKYIHDYNLTFGEYLEQKTISFLSIFIGIFGFLGNAVVLWLLGFRIKRNSFTIFILNLAVADMGVLISLATFFAVEDPSSDLIYVELIIFTYSTGQFLLTVISIDRCLCVLFPIWHRLRRPSQLSTFVCATIWVLSFLLSGIHYILFQTGILEKDHPLTFYQFFVSALLCLPLMIISTLTLSIKVCFKSQQRQRGRLLRAILLTLLFFLLFAFPLNAAYFHFAFSRDAFPSPMRYGLLCASLNSSINPLIYFVVGRKREGPTGESLKVVLRRILEEEEEEEEG
ncbi:mas-related G-protein coupled receptor member H-like [Sphaerodactylus townsendi]|uniref:mas-related G-protein coupled receptor member H-like n=1 Tax=Sphaerodactylus townsendi TaxID=933632 RepID=UPI002025D2E3|nr:mas-related G-protein coupled receptor member H-like [Sphaerodactylus townsendi]